MSRQGQKGSSLTPWWRCRWTLRPWTWVWLSGEWSLPDVWPSLRESFDWERACGLWQETHLPEILLGQVSKHWWHQKATLWGFLCSFVVIANCDNWDVRALTSPPTSFRGSQVPKYLLKFSFVWEIRQKQFCIFSLKDESTLRLKA